MHWFHLCYTTQAGVNLFVFFSKNLFFPKYLPGVCISHRARDICIKRWVKPFSKGGGTHLIPASLKSAAQMVAPAQERSSPVPPSKQHESAQPLPPVTCVTFSAPLRWTLNISRFWLRISFDGYHTSLHASSAWCLFPASSPSIPRRLANTAEDALVKLLPPWDICPLYGLQSLLQSPMPWQFLHLHLWVSEPKRSSGTKKEQPRLTSTGVAVGATVKALGKLPYLVLPPG